MIAERLSAPERIAGVTRATAQQLPRSLISHKFRVDISYQSIETGAHVAECHRWAGILAEGQGVRRAPKIAVGLAGCAGPGDWGLTALALLIIALVDSLLKTRPPQLACDKSRSAHGSPIPSCRRLHFEPRGGASKRLHRPLHWRASADWAAAGPTTGDSRMVRR
jgi:hypothetical protein